MPRERRHQDLGSLQQRSRLPIRLIFEAAEVRSRHLLYEGDDLCLDLCLDRRRGGVAHGAHTKVTGQLAHRHDPLKPLTDLPVLVTSGEQILARSASNRQGEFELEYEDQGATALYVPIGKDQLIEVPM